MEMWSDTSIEDPVVLRLEEDIPHRDINSQQIHTRNSWTFEFSKSIRENSHCRAFSLQKFFFYKLSVQQENEPQQTKETPRALQSPQTEQPCRAMSSTGDVFDCFFLLLFANRHLAESMSSSKLTGPIWFVSFLEGQVTCVNYLSTIRCRYQRSGERRKADLPFALTSDDFLQIIFCHLWRSDCIRVYSSDFRTHMEAGKKSWIHTSVLHVVLATVWPLHNFLGGWQWIVVKCILAQRMCLSDLKLLKHGFQFTDVLVQNMHIVPESAVHPFEWSWIC